MESVLGEARTSLAIRLFQEKQGPNCMLPCRPLATRLCPIPSLAFASCCHGNEKGSLRSFHILTFRSKVGKPDISAELFRERVTLAGISRRTLPRICHFQSGN